MEPETRHGPGRIATHTKCWKVSWDKGPTYLFKSIRGCPLWSSLSGSGDGLQAREEEGGCTGDVVVVDDGGLTVWLSAHRLNSNEYLLGILSKYTVWLVGGSSNGWLEYNWWIRHHRWWWIPFYLRPTFNCVVYTILFHSLYLSNICIWRRPRSSPTHYPLQTVWE